MKRQSVIIFPDTVPFEQVCIPLVQVFEPLVYCQPVENDPEPDEQSIFYSELVSQVVPAPLGTDRDRFMHLVSDLRNRRDDYAAQLGHLSLASMPSVGRREKESKSSIISSLLSSHGIVDSTDMILWQARLVLKLGELFDEEQRLIQDEMKRISDRERGLISDLRKDTEHPFTLTEKLFSSSSENNELQRLRLKAWSRIFALGAATPVDSGCFVTRNRDAVDRLAEEFERKTGTGPAEIISLSLPFSFPRSSKFSEQYQQFCRQGEELLEHLTSILENPSQISDRQQSLFRGHESSWEALLEQYYPQQNCGRCRLVLYDFSGIPAKQLFLDSFGSDDKLQAEPLQAVKKGVVIGVLELAEKGD